MDSVDISPNLAFRVSHVSLSDDDDDDERPDFKASYLRKGQLRTAGCRALAEEDEAANGQGGPVEEAMGPSGQELYQRGTYASSPHKSMSAYLTRSAGMFMDVAEGLVNNHLRNEDLYSGLITSEW